MDITNLLMQYLSSEETYQFTRDIKLRVLYGDPSHIKSVLQALSKFISDSKEQPILRLLALKFNKELAETFSEEYIYLMQKIVLPKLEIIAQFQKESSDPEKGKLIFLQNEKPSQSNKELQSIGQQFYKTVLDCIWVWSKWFPLDQKYHVLSQYKVTLEKLLKNGVKFMKVEYFDFQIILKHMPLSIPPLPMIIQLRHLLRAQPNNSTKQLCDHLMKNPAFEIYKSKYHSYGDMLNQVAMRSIVTRVQRKRTGTLGLGLGDFILEADRKIKKQVSMQSSQDSKAYLQAILVEKQQAENMNSCFEQKNKELQKQIINLQNQTVLLQKELEVKENVIIQITNQLNNIENKFGNLFERFQDKYPQNTCTIAQFERDMQKFREQYETSTLTVELKKLRVDYNNLKAKKEELEFQFDNICKENECLLRLNQQLEQKIMKFERKKLSKPTSNTQSFKELDRQDSIDSHFKINTTKNQIMIQQQQIVQLKAQIALLKDQILKGEKKPSQSSTFSINTLQQFKSNQNIIKSFLESQQSISPHSKIDTTRHYISYNPEVFAIHPNSFNLRFRQACLISKGLLLSDDNIQIGIQSHFKFPILYFTLGIINKSNINIDNFELRFTQSKDLQVFSEENQILKIYPKQQIQLKISTQILKTPYQLQEFQIYYIINGVGYTQNLCLPCTINKYFIDQGFPQKEPIIYFYNSQPFPTCFQAQLSSLLPEFKIHTKNENEFEALKQIEINKKHFLLSIYIKRSQMQIRLNGDYEDKLAEFIISTYQGLFFKR